MTQKCTLLVKSFKAALSIYIYKSYEREAAIDTEKYTKVLDACGLCCLGPLMSVKEAVDNLKNGEVLKVNASDPGFY